MVIQYVLKPARPRDLLDYRTADWSVSTCSVGGEGSVGQDIDLISDRDCYHKLTACGKRERKRGETGHLRSGV